MCPACIVTATSAIAGAAWTGGLTAFAAGKLWRRKQTRAIRASPLLTRVSSRARSGASRCPMGTVLLPEDRVSCSSTPQQSVAGRCPGESG